MKNLSLALAALAVALSAAVCRGVSPSDGSVSRKDLMIRDPFVLAEKGVYYLYASLPEKDGRGVGVYTSSDLETWKPRPSVLKLPADSGCTAVWAPEVHRHAGAYWLFVTLSFGQDPANPIQPMVEPGYTGGKLLKRGVWVYRSDSPTGPFTPVARDSVTPRDWMCLDGTLWVENGVPWMVFCHEWVQTGNGRMMAAPMSADLTRFTAEPVELFRASAAPGGGKVTDGPFLIAPKGAGLRMIWSNFQKDGGGYCVFQCKSATGKVAGPWQMQTLLFRGDGGHAMLFNKFDGQLTMALHQPNRGNLERMKLFPIGTSWEGLSRVDWDPFGPEWQRQWSPDFEKAIDARIERHRKADAKVEGLPAGCEVKVDQVSSKFLFGAHLFNFNQIGSDAMNAAYRAAFTNLFNAATLAFYWKEFEPVEGQPRYRSGPRDLASFWNAFDFEKDEPEQHVEWRRPAPDAVIDFCRANGISMHGHAIVYVPWTPAWVWEKAKTPAEARVLFDRRVSEIARYYGDTIPQWDVVNESLNRNSTKASPDDAESWYSAHHPEVVLPPDYTRRAFEVAAENFPPSVRLAINDAWSMQNGAYAAFAGRLVREGAKIDVVGYQKHIFRPANLLTIASGYPCITNSQTWNLDEEESRLKEIDELGRPIHLSEITIPSPRGLHGLTDAEADEIQARVTRAYYRYWFSWPSVDRITYWNLVDGLGIKKERMSSGWFERDMSPKRVGRVMQDLLCREWRTHLTARADAGGRLAFRGFKGRYRLTWQENGREVVREIVVD